MTAASVFAASDPVASETRLAVQMTSAVIGHALGLLHQPSSPCYLHGARSELKLISLSYLSGDNHDCPAHLLLWCAVAWRDLIGTEGSPFNDCIAVVAKALLLGEANDIELYEPRMLVHRLGLGPRPRAPIYPTLSVSKLFDADVVTCAAYLKRIAVASGFGELPTTTSEDFLASVIQIGVTAIETRSIELACLAFRVARYLGLGNAWALDQVRRALRHAWVRTLPLAWPYDPVPVCPNVGRNGTSLGYDACGRNAIILAHSLVDTSERGPSLVSGASSAKLQNVLPTHPVALDDLSNLTRH